jgi:hypothetical protein
MGLNTQSSWFETFVAQVAHFGAAYTILSVFILRFPKYQAYAAFGMVVYAVLKEFWYDANYEIPKQPFLNNLLDFSMYVGGVITAFVVVYAR